MTVSSRHMLSQGPVLATIAHTAFSALRPRVGTPQSRRLPSLPGPEVRARIRPLPRALVKDYIRHVGGDPWAYPDTLPAHLFPQWAVPLAAQTLRGLPYPMHKIVNAGCRLELRAPLPAEEILVATARLEDAEDTGHQLRLHQRITTSSASAVEALVAHIYARVPYAHRERRGPRPDPIRVPATAEEIARWRLPRDAGLDFAKLTGDFNPLHWSPGYARLAGFKNTILHGFSTLARTVESLQRNRFAGSTHHLSVIDVQFRRPLVLPARVGVYVHDDGVFVGEAPGTPAYLSGRFETRIPTDAA